ncbi:MAG: hypothetical protein LBH61_08250 [Dysgonamonadaceae bacterium]|jgi:hypothetical protein|nr:hypothetical protein [Dysgonamonadaceae bacterium]
MTKSSRYIACLVLLNLVLTVGLMLFRSSVFTDSRPYTGAGVAIAFFFFYEIAVILLTQKKTVTPRQSVNLFLGLKAGKIVLSLVFVTLYALVVKVEVKRFVLVFVLLYFIYLLFDTIYLTKNEKKEKTIK